MNALIQAYRTTCVPKGDDRLDTLIPSEYIGRKLEIIILPQDDEPQYNEETLVAMREAMDIVNGKVKAKRYKTAAEMHADILAEVED